MTDADWADSSRQILGMLIDGQATDEVDERGRPVFGDTVLLLMNGSGRSKSFALPAMEGPGMWQEIVNTARPGAIRSVKSRPVNLVAHSLILLRFSADPGESHGGT
jgi:glycogen operon protein